MTLVENKTKVLFKGFMPRRAEIKNRISDDIYDVQIYPENHFNSFSPSNQFTKWVGYLVNSSCALPDGMETLEIPKGLYAVFSMDQLPNTSNPFEYIFTKWIPASKYSLDRRPHFDVLEPHHQTSKSFDDQKIWIPVKLNR